MSRYAKNESACVFTNFKPPNGWRYPLVGGTRSRHFDGTNFKPRKPLENAHAAKRQSQHHGPGCSLPGFGCTLC